MTTALDETDRTILHLLQRDARMTNAAIAAEVGLTAPSVFERVRKLEQRGVIRGYRASVDPAALGKKLTAFIRLTLAYDDKHRAGLQAIQREPDVLEAYSVAGEDCLLVKTVVSDPAELEALIDRIRRQVTVLRSVTMIALTTIKEDGTLEVLQPGARKIVKAPARPRRKLSFRSPVSDSREKDS